MTTEAKDKTDRQGELKAAREAQKRLTWINNVKRIYNWDQETAEREWTKIHNQPKP